MNQKLILWAANNPRNEISQMVLSLTEEFESLKKELESYKVVAWARTNDKGDLFDLRLQNNPYVDQNLVLPLYAKSKV
jgi:hypothetical protein